MEININFRKLGLNQFPFLNLSAIYLGKSQMHTWDSKKENILWKLLKKLCREFYKVLYKISE